MKDLYDRAYMLQVAKVEAERDEAAKAAADSKRELEAVKATLLRTKEDVEGRDSELEAKGGWGHQSDWMEMILWSALGTSSTDFRIMHLKKL